jgi:hypothetical protein
MEPAVMEPAAVEPAAMETAGVKTAAMKTAAVGPSKSAAMEPAAASAMWTSISHAWLAERSSEYHSGCSCSQNGTPSGPNPSAA